jgi:hypothetical protein
MLTRSRKAEMPSAAPTRTHRGWMVKTSRTSKHMGCNGGLAKLSSASGHDPLRYVRIKPGFKASVALSQFFGAVCARNWSTGWTSGRRMRQTKRAALCIQHASYPRGEASYWIWPILLSSASSSDRRSAMEFFSLASSARQIPPTLGCHWPNQHRLRSGAPATRAAFLCTPITRTSGRLTHVARPSSQSGSSPTTHIRKVSRW